jgi:hypothetical protein
MRLIPLTQGKFTQIDDEDYDHLITLKWYAVKNNNTFYAMTKITINGVRKTKYMHRMILNTPCGYEGEHSDRNGLNNQRYNLRNATHSQNQMNRKSWGSSPYLGVSIRNGSITARIKLNGKCIYLGAFKSEKDAAIAYDNAARQHHGEFANLNFM